MTKEEFSRPWRFPVSCAPVLFGFFLTGIMTLVISAIATLRTLGLATVMADMARFRSAWMTAYYSSWLVAFPTLIVVAPFVRRVVARLTRQ